MIRLHRKLFWGEEAGKHRTEIRKSLKAGRPSGELYFIFLPIPGTHFLLEIIPSRELYGRSSLTRASVAVGLAFGKEEALEVTGRIVDTVYRATGGFGLRDYFERECGRKK